MQKVLSVSNIWIFRTILLKVVLGVEVVFFTKINRSIMSYQHFLHVHGNDLPWTLLFTKLAIDEYIFFIRSLGLMEKMDSSIYTIKVYGEILLAETLYSDNGTFRCHNTLIGDFSRLIDYKFPTSLLDKRQSNNQLSLNRHGCTQSEMYLIPAEPLKFQSIYGQFYTGVNSPF